MGTINLGKVIGPPGNTGATGPVGPKGNDGSIGPAGERGLRGKSFDPDATGLESGRSVYDDQSVGFSYLATDTKLVYWREGTGWSIGVPFGGSTENGTTILLILLQPENEEVVLEWTEDLFNKHGNMPLTLNLYEFNGGVLKKCSSPDYTEDNGLTWRFYVGLNSSRIWMLKIGGYVDQEIPTPPIPVTPSPPTSGITNQEEHEFNFTPSEVA